ncbi:MAG: phage holin family protein [Candidatus Portnoybacteria bacterium]|nr:phage holin family protein [Candidatus Portnoybacteria bacterium]
MTYFILHLLGNSLAIYLAARYIQGISFSGDIVDLLAIGAFLGLLNFFIKPILKIISAPLILVTLGLFIFIINLALLWFTQYLFPALTIEGFTAYFWTLIILTLINFILHRYHNE